MIKKQTYLPCFSGFYGTDYYNENYLFESEFSNFKNKDKKIYAWFENNFYEYIDYSDIHNDIARLYVDYMNTLDNNIQFEFENLYRPKYYNYSNDIINVLCKVKNWKLLYNFLIENKSKFETYIKEKYTSYDGFWSNYSNDFNDWLDLLKHPKNKDLSHELGSVLEFYYDLNYEEVDFNFLFYISDNFYVCDYIDYAGILGAFNSEFETDFNTIEDIFECNSISKTDIEKYKFKKILENTNLKLID